MHTKRLGSDADRAELNGNDRDLLATVSRLQTLQGSPRAADIFTQLDSERGGITRPTVYRRLDELVDSGFLHRTDGGDDMRVVRYTLTEKAESVLESLYHQYLQVVSLSSQEDGHQNEMGVACPHCDYSMDTREISTTETVVYDTNGCK